MEKFVFQMNLDVHSSDHALCHSLIIHRDQVVNTVEVCWFWGVYLFFVFVFVCLVWFLSGLSSVLSFLLLKSGGVGAWSLGSTCSPFGHSPLCWRRGRQPQPLIRPSEADFGICTPRTADGIVFQKAQPFIHLHILNNYKTFLLWL